MIQTKSLQRPTNDDYFIKLTRILEVCCYSQVGCCDGCPEERRERCALIQDRASGSSAGNSNRLTEYAFNTAVRHLKDIGCQI